MTDEKNTKKSKVFSWKRSFRCMLPSTCGLLPFRKLCKVMSWIAVSSRTTKIGEDVSLHKKKSRKRDEE
jgi:hypothetical protein